MKQQILGVDVIRFLSAMMVFVYHFGFWHTVPADETFALWNPVDSYPLREAMHFGWVGVEIFFVVSGFVIAFSAQDATPGSFFVARALRLAPAVWFCAPITFVVYFYILSTPASQLLINLLRTLFFVPLLCAIDGVYWTLGIEISFYYLIWVMLAKRVPDAPERLPVYFLLLGFTFWSAYFLASHALDPDAYGALLHRLATQRALQLLLVQHGCFFGLGILMSTMLRRRLSRAEMVCFAGLVATCWLEIVGQNRIISQGSGVLLSPWPALWVWTAATLALVLSVVLHRGLSVRLGRFAATIRTLGLMSYPIYLLHNPIGLAVYAFNLGGRGFFANLAIAAGLIVVASWLVASYIEPFLRRRLRGAFLAMQGRPLIVGRAA